MIRRKFLVKNEITFSTKYYGEDDLFAYEISSKASMIGITNKKTYLYISREYSICNSKIKKLNLNNCAYWDVPTIIVFVDKKLAKKSQYLQMYVFIAINELPYKEWKKCLVQQNIHHLSSKYVKGKDKIGAILFNLSKYLCYHITPILRKLEN